MATTKTQSEQMVALATRLGTEIKTIKANIGTLTSLKTTDKTALVAAINEVVGSVSTAQTTLNSYATRITNVESKASTNATGLSTANSNIGTLQTNLSNLQSELKSLQDVVNAQTSIDDSSASTTKTYSSSKITSEITAAKAAVKNDLLGGAGAAYDTLKELADLITTNGDAITSLQSIAAGHVKFDAAQTLTDTQKAQARTNIGAADSSTVSGYGTRLTTVESKASANATSISNLKTAVGDTTVDLVAKFEEALEASA